MSLERKDVRAKLDPELHAALDEICEQLGTTHADWIESIIAPVLHKRIAETIELAQRFQRRGITGSARE